MITKLFLPDITGKNTFSDHLITCYTGHLNKIVPKNMVSKFYIKNSKLTQEISNFYVSKSKFEEIWNLLFF